MIIKYRITIFFFIVSILLSECFSQTSISGSIIDSITNKEIPYTLILVKNSSDSVTFSTYSNELGNFSISIPSHNCKYLQFSCLGYCTKQINLLKYKQSSNLKLRVLLFPKINELEQVNIVSNTADVTKKIDRTVYKINFDQKNTSNDLYDILSSLPGVIVDKNNNSIKFKGENPEILIENMPASIIFPKLEMINIKEIEAIELIDRSALYGGEGKGGLINVKIKKIKKSKIGSFISSDVSYNSEVNEINYFENFINVNGFLGPILLFNNLKYNTINNNLQSDYAKTQILNNDKYYTDYHDLQKTNTQQFNNTIGAWLPSEKTNIILAFALQDDKLEKNKLGQFNNFVLNSKITNYNDKNNCNKNANSFFYHLKLFQKFKKDREFSLTFTNSKTIGNSKILNQFNYTTLNQINSSKIDTYKINENVKTKTTLGEFYYNHPLNTNTRLNIHGSYFSDKYPENILYTTLNDNKFPQLNKINTREIKQFRTGSNIGIRINKYIFDANVNYIYSNNSGNFIRFPNDTINIINIVNIKNNFISPSLRISYNINKKNDVYFGYSHNNKIAEPEVYIEFIDKQNPHLWEKGNSHIKPEYFHNFYLAYKYSKIDTLNFSSEIFYKTTNNGISNISTPIFSDVYQKMPVNIAFYQQIGSDISVWFKIFKNWKISAASEIKHSFIDTKIDNNIANEFQLNITKKQFAYSSKYQLSYKYRKNLGFSFWITQNSREILFNGYIEPYYNISFAASRKFFKNHLFINIGLDNLLSNFKITYENYYNSINKTRYIDFYENKLNIQLYIYYIFKSGHRDTDQFKLLK